MVAPINPTQLTPPRVAFIDERTGAISREWYRFFLSLLTATEANQQQADTGPNASSLLASYDALLDNLAQGVQSAPDAASAVVSLSDGVDNLAQAFGVAPQPPLGTMASVQQDNVRFLGFSRFPSPPVVYTPGVLAWNNDDGTLDVGLNGGAVLQLGQETLFYAKNTSGSSIPIGTPVMFTGVVGASGKLTFGLAVANGTVPPEYMMGVAAQTIANNDFGYVTSFGLVRGFNTSGTPYGQTWADGDLLYFNPATPGGWTNVEPVAPNIHVPVAVVINAASGGSGSIFVRMIQSQRLGELQDVIINGIGPTAGQTLIYDATQQRWENNTLTAGSNVTITNGDGSITIAATDQYVGTVTSVDVSGGTTGLTFSGGPITTSGTITMAGTLGVTNGGTGLTTTPTNGQLLIGNGTGYTLAALTAGTGISVTNGAGSITVTNAAPDQIVSLTGAGTTSISGTYPNFTITSNDAFVGTVTSVSGTGTVNGITLTGTVTSSGNLTLGGTLSGVSLTTQVTGTLPVANGGTGVTTSTGTGSVVLSNSPTLVTPTLGAASATSIANGLGAVGTPSYTFTGDLNTGMWSPAADTIAFSEGGVEAMRINSSANVGIGTSAPGGKAHISSISSGTVPATLILSNTVANSAGTGADLRFYVNDGGSDRYAAVRSVQATSGNVADLRFITSNSDTPAERMRIDPSGNLLVGTTTIPTTTGWTAQMYAGGSYTRTAHNTAAGSGDAFSQFYRNSLEIGSITQMGTTGVLYNISSDARLKENVAPADDAAALIDAIQVRKFDWKVDGSHQRYGFVAQELIEVAPEAVSAPADEDQMMGVDYSKLVPMLVKEMQSLRTRVAELERSAKP